MLKAQGYAVDSPEASFEPFEFERRAVGPKDVNIEILYCGVCHSDIHQARGEWGNSTYPMVPGHEIVGVVTEVGAEVTKFAIGDFAGVGCFVDSCRNCKNCDEGCEQFCLVHTAATYNGTEMDKETMTFGGYSDRIVMDEYFALKISPDQELANVAPLLCAGITTYSPLKRFGAGPGKKVGVVGLGGLGHMGVKLAVAMGADVTVFSTSPSKEDDARALGAHHFVVTKDPANLRELKGTFDLLIDTVSADHDLNIYLALLAREAALVMVGLPENPINIAAFSIVGNNRILAGSSIGGIEETQEMLDYCAEKNIVSDVEVIPIQKIAEAYERTIKSDVRYRFVIDIASLKD